MRADCRGGRIEIIQDNEEEKWGKRYLLFQREKARERDW
jgi:hypothetical protein